MQYDYYLTIKIFVISCGFNCFATNPIYDFFSIYFLLL